MRPDSLLLFAAAFLAAAGVADAPERPAPAPRDSVVVTVSDGTALSFDVSADGRFLIADLLGGLWTIPVDGGTARALTDPLAERADDRQPALAPGGGWIATRSDRPEGRGIWLHSTDGGTHRQLTDSALILGDDVGLPAWAPDGRRLAFVRQGGVFLLDPRGGAPMRLAVTGMTSGLDEPDWHPDGGRLALSGPWRGGSARGRSSSRAPGGGPRRPGRAGWRTRCPAPGGMCR